MAWMYRGTSILGISGQDRTFAQHCTWILIQYVRFCPFVIVKREIQNIVKNDPIFFILYKILRNNSRRVQLLGTNMLEDAWNVVAVVFFCPSRPLESSQQLPYLSLSLSYLWVQQLKSAYASWREPIKTTGKKALASFTVYFLYVTFRFTEKSSTAGDEWEDDEFTSWFHVYHTLLYCIIFVFISSQSFSGSVDLNFSFWITYSPLEWTLICTFCLF